MIILPLTTAATCPNPFISVNTLEWGLPRPSLSPNLAQPSASRWQLMTSAFHRTTAQTPSATILPILLDNVTVALCRRPGTMAQTASHTCLPPSLRTIPSFPSSTLITASPTLLLSPNHSIAFLKTARCSLHSLGITQTFHPS